MAAVRLELLMALGAAALLWAASRTKVGGEVIAKALDTTAQVFSGPRGIRNNNPGNIERTADQWRGMSADQSADDRFAVFDAPVWGLRAMARILRRYIASGNDTVREIINRWAPPVENDSGAYVNHVAQLLGLDPDTPIGAEHLPTLMQAIVMHENGVQPYADVLFADAIALEQQT